MLNITDEIKVSYRGEGLFVFDRPSTDELNAYGRAKFPSVGRRIKNNMAVAQVTYFDRWLRRIEEVQVNGTPITLDNLALLPASIKCAIMFETFDRPEAELVDDDSGGEPVGEDLEGN